MVEIGEAVLWRVVKSTPAPVRDELLICCGYKGNMIKDYFTSLALRPPT